MAVTALIFKKQKITYYIFVDVSLADIFFFFESDEKYKKSSFTPLSKV
jgi:hypothetical protein